jgi:hypothetical protein
MASSASSASSVSPAVLLPLIPCPHYGDRIVLYVAKRGQHLGTRFYMCCHHEVLLLALNLAHIFACLLCRVNLRSQIQFFFRAGRMVTATSTSGSHCTLLGLKSQEPSSPAPLQYPAPQLPHLVQPPRRQLCRSRPRSRR